MQQIPIRVIHRKETGKSAARSMRAKGIIPAVIYGIRDRAESIGISDVELEKVLGQIEGSVAFLKVVFEGETGTRMAMLQEIQRDSLGFEFFHVDLLEILPDKMIEVNISIKLEGVARGTIEEGGILNQSVHNVPVKGLVKDIPDILIVDVSRLSIEESFMAGELVLPKNVEGMWKKDFAIVGCSRPSVVELVEDEELTEDEEQQEVEAQSDDVKEN